MLLGPKGPLSLSRPREPLRRDESLSCGDHRWLRNVTNTACDPPRRIELDEDAARVYDRKGGSVPERSPVIERVLRDILDAMVRSDVDEIGRCTSRDACVLSIGSDAGEWPEGYDEIMRLFRESTPRGRARRQGRPGRRQGVP